MILLTATTGQMLQAFQASEVVLWLYFGQFLGHLVSEKSNVELCARLRTFSLHEQTVTREIGSRLEASIVGGLLGLQGLHRLIQLYNPVLSVTGLATCNHLPFHTFHPSAPMNGLKSCESIPLLSTA